MLKRMMIVVCLGMLWTSIGFAASDPKMTSDAHEMLDSIMDVKLAIDTRTVNYKEYHDMSRKAIMSIYRFNNKYTDADLKNLREDAVTVSLLYQYIDTVWKYDIEGSRTDIDGVDVMQRDFSNLQNLHRNFWGRWNTKDVFAKLVDNIDNKVKLVDIDVQMIRGAN